MLTLVIKVAQISASQSTGSISDVDSQRLQSLKEQEALTAKIAANQEAIAKYVQEFNDPKIQDALKTFGLQGQGAEAIRVKANQPELADSKDQKLLLQGADLIDQVNAVTQQTNEYQGQISQSVMQSQDALRSTNRSLTDYFKSVTDNVAEMGASVKSAQLDTALQEQKK